MLAHDLTVYWEPLLKYQQAPWNAHTGDVEEIARSIARNGFYAPMVVQVSTGYIIKGNHTWAAGLFLGLEEGPFVHLDVDDERAKRIAIADNRTARLGRDDESLVLTLLEELRATDEGFEGTGYDFEDYTELLESVDGPLQFDLDAEIQPKRLVRPARYRVMPVVDDQSGQSFEFVLSREDEEPLTGGDLNKIRAAMGDPVLTKAELRDQGVPAWARRG